MSEQNEVSIVFKELDKTIQKIGAEKLIQILKYSRKNTASLSEEQIQEALKIVQIVCDEFKITLEDFFDTKRKNNRRVSIGISAYILQKKLNLDTSNISYILKKPDTLVSLYKQEILRLNEEHPSDKPIFEKLKNIINNIDNLYKND
jgi:chromosomal replication initiation ATPase DnaA